MLEHVPPLSSTQSKPSHRVGVFLIHGLTGSPTEMTSLEKALRRAGYHTTVPLIAGHGAGHRELLATRWQDWRDGLRKELRAFAQTCDEVVVIGLCVGGLLGALLAAEDERVQGLVSLAPDLGFRVPGPAMPWTRFLLPVASRIPWLRRHGYWTQRPPYGLKDPKLQQRVARAVAASVRGETKEYGTFRTYVGTLVELRQLQDAVTAYLADVRCPVLMIHSFEDSMFSIRNVTSMYRRLGSPNKQVALITGCDHVLTVDMRRKEVASRVAQFIAGLHPESSSEAIDSIEQDPEFFTCEITPIIHAAAAQPARPSEPKSGPCDAHRLIVRQGTAIQRTLTLVEDGAAPAARHAVRHPTSGQNRAEQLASIAIDALSFSFKHRLAVMESEQPFGHAMRPTLHAPIPGQA